MSASPDPSVAICVNKFTLTPAVSSEYWALSKPSPPSSPAVVAVEDQQGAWDRSGQSRVIRLADGSAMREELTRVDRPSHFAYSITELSGPLGRLTSVFHGAWWFEARAEHTHARWQYRFEPRSAWLRAPIFLVVRGFWQPYMARALTLASRIAEAQQ